MRLVIVSFALLFSTAFAALPPVYRTREYFGPFATLDKGNVTWLQTNKVEEGNIHSMSFYARLEMLSINVNVPDVGNLSAFYQNTYSDWYIAADEYKMFINLKTSSKAAGALAASIGEVFDNKALYGSVQHMNGRTQISILYAGLPKDQKSIKDSTFEIKHKGKTLTLSFGTRVGINLGFVLEANGTEDGIPLEY
jgi:hypothetical protein